jgi:hypothetical protein
MKVSEVLETHLASIRMRKFRSGSVIRALPFKGLGLRFPNYKKMRAEALQPHVLEDWLTIRNYCISVRIGALLLLNFEHKPKTVSLANFLSNGREAISLTLAQRQILNVGNMPSSGVDISAPYTSRSKPVDSKKDLASFVVRSHVRISVVDTLIDADRNELERLVKECDRVSGCLTALGVLPSAVPRKSERKKITKAPEAVSVRSTSVLFTGRAAELARMVEEMERSGQKMK